MERSSSTRVHIRMNQPRPPATRLLLTRWEGQGRKEWTKEQIPQNLASETKSIRVVLKAFRPIADRDHMSLQARYQELCCHCTSPAIGYFERPIKHKGDASSISWLCRVHVQVYPLDRLVFTRVTGSARDNTQATADRVRPP